MIKSLLIKRKLNTSESNSPVSLGYLSVESIGLLFNEHQEPKSLEFLKNQFIADGKKIRTMMRVTKYEKTKSYDHPFFFQKDIGISGSIQSEVLAEFIQKPMDMLIVLDQEPDLLTSYVASKCKGLKIGFYSELAPIQQLDLLVKPKNESTKYQELLEYVRKVA